LNITIFSTWNENILEIRVTIYTPINVDKDKLVIFLHGGGKSIDMSWLALLQPAYDDLGWADGSRISHQPFVNAAAEFVHVIYCFICFLIDYSEQQIQFGY